MSEDVLGIAGDTLSFALNAAAETHPNEYMGYLRTEPAGAVGLERTGRVITDVLVIPGTTSNTSSASVKSIMKHNSVGSVGTIHSHPSGRLHPSSTDLKTFRAGQVNVIMGRPYEWNDWRAFDRDGEPMHLAVLDVDLPDPADFFDFTQEDLDRAFETKGERGESADTDYKEAKSAKSGDRKSSGWFSRLFGR